MDQSATVGRKNMVDNVIAEKTALAIANNPYVVKLYYSFQSREHLFLVMEYLIGGDLSSLLHGMANYWLLFS
jgi:serine/threonine protein kinase